MRPPATMRRISIQLPATGVLEVPAAGDFLFVEAASADATARVDQTGRGATVADGILIRAAASYRFRLQYDRIVVTGTAGATVTMWSGEGDANLNLLSGSVSVSNQAGSTVASPADVSIANSASLDFAADATLRERALQAAQGNTGELCVRDQSGTTSAGFRLYPGGHIIWGNYAALRVRNNSGAAQTLQILNNQN